MAPAQQSGHSTSVCHRPNGRRRENESRLGTHEGSKQRTKAFQRPLLLFTKTRT